MQSALAAGRSVFYGRIRKGGWSLKCIVKNARVFENGRMVVRDFSFADAQGSRNGEVFLDSKYVFPGFADVHVHFREPGFSYKETIATGSRAAARGGCTAVCTMPNLNPVPDSPVNLQPQLDAIHRDAVIRVLPYGAISVGEKGEALADLEGLAPLVCAFSDDGRGVQDAGMMREAMQRAKALGKLIAAHCEDNSLLRGGYIHDGAYARAHGHRGICSESEWRPIERDLKLAAETGCGYHVCHISTKESVQLIRDAKASGVDVSCETGPHYLLLDDSCMQEDGRFKMNPPLRDRTDREALIEGLCDGTIDMIATDHAPHSAEEKGRGLEKSAMGVVGIETAFSLLYAGLVQKGILTLEALVGRMSVAPRKRFALGGGEIGRDFTVFDLDARYAVDPAEFLSMGRSTPFAGAQAQGRCLLTVADGRVAWMQND